MSIKFNYYYGKEAEQFSFFRIPKLLFIEPIFKELSNDAKVLYGILLDRMSLSMKNNWIDEENKVYIIFTIEEIAEILCCATQKATKILQELDDKKGIGLVEKKRLGLGRPNILYVKNFIIQEGKDKKDRIHTQEEITNQELCKSQFKNDENHNSRNVKFRIPELSKSQCNKTHSNKTEYNDTNLNNTTPISPSKESVMKEGSDYQEQKLEEEKIIEILKQNIEYFLLIEAQPKEKEKIELILNLMIEVIQNRVEIRVNQGKIPYEKVKKQFLSIQRKHIEYVLEYLRENKQKITNLRAYLLSLLYNAPINILGMNQKESDIVDYRKDIQVWQDFLNST